MTHSLRRIDKIVPSRLSTDGDGVRIQRNIPETQKHDMDPFLMLDEIRSADSADYIGGFPPHPHRGIETLTYMLSGGFVHEDNMGHREELRDGGAQWMFSGRGVIHSELPLIHEGLLHGFQLWINIPAKYKMDKPVYQQATRQQLSTMTLADGSSLHAFGGEWQIGNQQLSSPFKTMSAHARTLDVRLAANGKLLLNFPAPDKVLAYVYEGSLAMSSVVKPKNMIYFSSGEQLELAAGNEGVRLLLLAGTPLNEPIVQYGPFVMNTEAEIQQALNDYRNGKF